MNEIRSMFWGLFLWGLLTLMLPPPALHKIYLTFGIIAVIYTLYRLMLRLFDVLDKRAMRGRW